MIQGDKNMDMDIERFNNVYYVEVKNSCIK